MPIRYKVFDGGDLVYTVGSGVIDDEDSVNHQASLATDESINPGYREIFDMRYVEEFQIDESTIEKIVEIEMNHQERMKNVKCAVISNEYLLFKLQRMFQSPESETLIVFNDLKTGAKWLGVNEVEKYEQEAMKS